MIDEEELRSYFYYIRNDQLWEASTIRVAYSGIKFFYEHTCPRDWATLRLVRVEDVLKLPTVLSIDDTRKLLESIRQPCHYAFFWTVYSMGLRMQEALNLQVSDIDAKRGLVHVQRGKGHKAQHACQGVRLAIRDSVELHYDWHSSNYAIPNPKSDPKEVPPDPKEVPPDLTPEKFPYAIPNPESDPKEVPNQSSFRAFERIERGQQYSA